MKCRPPCLPLPLPLGTAGLRWKAGRGPRPLLLQALPHFPDFALATGAPILPTGSWALPAASVQLAFLPVCLLESACGGVTTGGGPGRQGEQEKSGVSPTAGPGGQSQPISFHCL